MLTMTLSVLKAAPVSNELPEGFKVLPDYPFVIIAEYGVDPDLQISDSLFNALAVGVKFRVNRTDINPKSEFFQIYNEKVLPLLFGQHVRLHKLFIRGAASPEGPYLNNRRLSIGRSKALSDLIGSDLQKAFGEGKPLNTDSQTITEDYGYLIDLMREANDPDYETVRDIFENAHHDEPATKVALQKAQGGKLWNRLYAQYFDRLRTARIVLLVSCCRPKLPPLDTEVSLLPTGPGASPIAERMFPVDYFRQSDNQTTRRHLLALRTNLLADGFYMPQFGWAPSLNAQLEYYPLDGHYTYNAGFTWSNHRHWQDKEFFQIRDAQLELRRYFKGGGEFTGTYLGLYAQGSVYGIGLSGTKGWEGEGGGAGLSLGYVLPISKKGAWRLEFMIAAGLYISRYDPYVYGNPITGTIDGDYYYNYFGSASSFKKRNHRFTWMGPTQFGIQLTRDILYRRKKVVSIK